MHEKLEMASEQIDMMIRQAEKTGNASSEWSVCDDPAVVAVYASGEGKRDFRVSVL